MVQVVDIAAPSRKAIAIGPFGSKLKAELYTSSGVPVVRGQDITDLKDLDESTMPFVSSATAESLRDCIVRPGDLIFPHRGAIGRVGVVIDKEYLLSSSMMKLSCNTSVAHPLFVFYYFRGPGRAELLSRASTVGTPGIGQPLKSLREIPVRLPTLPVQIGIAEVLGALDDKIAANRDLAGSGEELLSMHFHQLGLDEKSDPVPVTDLIEFNPSLPKPGEAEPTYVDMQSLPTSGMSISSWSSRPPKGGARFQNGDTLLARITPCLENRKTGFVDFMGEGQVGLGSTEFVVMRSREGVPSVISYLLSVSERFRTFAIRHMVGTSGRQRVGADVLREYQIGLPGSAELVRFRALSDPIVSMLSSLRTENRLLADTRDTLLPQLMSGKLRVKDAETQVEAVV